MKAKDMVRNAYRAILQNDFEQAIHWFESAIAAEPGQAEHYYRCSVTCSRSRRLGLAVEYALKAVELAPQRDDYLLHLHHLQARQLAETARRQLEPGSPESEESPYEAVRLLQKAIELDPLNGEAYVWLALAYAELEQYVLAVETLEEAITLHPQQEPLQLLKQDLYKRMASVSNKPSIQ
ncbi:tetratricopeptide repeat protein [Paenibacillus sp. JX-17]|uniref:Tetratricopeptide repeat protein n=1 Tax=Paenibacillus lacisoli TaxID=3064525 RepID=A0ABT9C723_9BACL|nr:tetratricopeptide repeat protein [Paenibacillus sp. JX-17]MDO7905041.1 tetratricopeptide repeat protein [Paenibacillus sp. JX-17]